MISRLGDLSWYRTYGYSLEPKKSIEMFLRTTKLQFMEVPPPSIPQQNPSLISSVQSGTNLAYNSTAALQKFKINILNKPNQS